MSRSGRVLAGVFWGMGNVAMAQGVSTTPTAPELPGVQLAVSADLRSGSRAR